MSESDHPDSAREDERRFVEGLVVRGEAVPEGTEPLPSHATHEIVEEQGGVASKVRRRRFSLSNELDAPEPVPARSRHGTADRSGLLRPRRNTRPPILSPPPIHLVGFEVFDFTLPFSTSYVIAGCDWA